MRIKFTNDEVFVLCALSGSDSVVGVANPFEVMSDEEISSRIKSILSELESNSVIRKDDNRYVIEDDYKTVINLITEPEMSYILVEDDESENVYVFLKNGRSVSMKNEKLETCYIEVFEDIGAFKDFFRQKFDFLKTHCDQTQYMISFPSDVIDNAIGKVEADEMEKAIEILGGDDFEKEEMESMLQAIVFPEKSKTVIGCNICNKITTESGYKVCDTPTGSWIIKISNIDEAKNTMIFKATVDDITKILFDF